MVFSPWCGVGSAQRPIPLEAIADHVNGMTRQTLTSVSRTDPTLEVHEATPRASTLRGQPHDLQHGMWGCYASKLACRVTVPKPRADAIDGIADLFASWVASLGAGVAQKCETLACIRGVHAMTGSRKDVIVLLLMSRQQPSLQFFARCAIAAGVEEPAAADGAEVLPEALPCVVSLRIVQSRLSSHFGL